MALVSNSVNRELEQVSRAIRESARTLRTLGLDCPVDYPKVAEALEAQAVRLVTLETTLDEKFLYALQGVRSSQQGEGANDVRPGIDVDTSEINGNARRFDHSRDAEGGHTSATCLRKEERITM
jgi:hypothetical protein